MKNISIWMVCLFCICGKALFANPQDTQRYIASPKVRKAFGYLEFGLGPFPIPIPVFGVGFRNQFHHHGLDLSFKASTLVYTTQFKECLMYHYYPKPSLRSQFYFGAGLGASVLYVGRFDQSPFLVSPEFVVGKNYLTDTGDRRFFQMQVSWPTISCYKIRERTMERGYTYKNAVYTLYYPLVVFSYGIGF